jgi:hypothetical protein
MRNTEDRRKAVAALAPFKSQRQIAEELGVGSKDTINSDIKVLRERGELPAPLTEFAFAEVRQKVEQLEHDLIDLKIDAEGKFKKRLDVFYAELEIVKLKLGTQPKRLDVTVGQKTAPLHYEFLEHVARLTPEQIQQVFDFADSLPRKMTVIDAELLQLGGGKPNELSDGVGTAQAEEICDTSN